MIEISVSLLSIDPENAIKTIYNLETAGVDYFHIDVMDGKFVENNTMERMKEYVNYIKQVSNLPIDVHLMVDNVKEVTKDFLEYEPNIITFQIEAVKSKYEILELINLIKMQNCRVGIAIKPKTSITEIEEFLPYVHSVLVMTVEPGKGGQAFIPETVKKIENLKEYIQKHHFDITIQVDGGINKETAPIVKKAGVENLVAGVAIVKSENYTEAVAALR